MWKQSLPPGLAQIGNLIESRIAPQFYQRTPVITLADSGRDELIHLGFKPNLVHVVNPGVDDLYSPDATTGITAEPSLVAVGRLAPVKRFQLLVETVEKVRESVPNLILNIVGDGPDKAMLEALAADRPWVHLRGRLETPELINLYRKSWLLVSASVAEGWGMTITEAGACGTPAVVIDNSGHRDATLNGTTGIVSANPDDLARDIQRVLTDSDLRSQLAAGALKRSESLRWDNTATATLSHLHSEVLRFQQSA
jgi:glycosyltransferase involved in cell wall biosynthesis